MSYETALAKLAVERENVVVMTAENRAHIRSLPEQLGRRFIDVGIAEQTLVGMAAGLALRGRVPVVHALAPFLTMRAFEFVRTDVVLPRLPVKLVGMIPGFLSEANGPTHQALEDIALMRALPGMAVFCPADADELALELPAVLDASGPCYVRYTGLARTLPPAATAAAGRAQVLARGRDVVLFAYGVLVGEAYAAAELLERRGVSAGVVNVRWLAPLDEACLLDAAREARAVVVIEDHFAVGGLYSALAELLVRRRLDRLVIPFAPARHWFRPAMLREVLDYEGFSAEAIALRVIAALEPS